MVDKSPSKIVLLLSNKELSDRQQKELIGYSLSNDSLILGIVKPDIISDDIKDALPFVIGILHQLQTQYTFQYEIGEMEYSSFYNPYFDQKGWKIFQPTMKV